MPRFMLRQAILSRRATLALCAATLLARPAGVRATHDLTCHPRQRVITTMKQLAIGLPVFGSSTVAFDIRVTVDPDGSAEMDGAILVVSANDGPMPGQDREPPMRLIAKETPAQTSCADADGDGQGGLVRVAAEMTDARSGEGVPVALEAASGQDLGEPGIYPLLLHIGDERVQVNARVALGPTRRRKRRRR